MSNLLKLLPPNPNKIINFSADDLFLIRASLLLTVEEILQDKMQNELHATMDRIFYLVETIESALETGE